jgi:hypothetical protein
MTIPDHRLPVPQKQGIAHVNVVTFVMPDIAGEV